MDKLPTACDGKEQHAFISWAESEKYDMSEHPLHWLFLNERTYAARQGWVAAIRYVNDRRAEASKPPARVASESGPLTDIHGVVAGEERKS